MTKTCSQCGAILLASTRICNFCDSSFPSGTASRGDSSASPPSGAYDQVPASLDGYAIASDDVPVVAGESEQASAWRGELSVRMEAYRARKRRRPTNTTQSRLPFEHSPVTTGTQALALDAVPNVAPDDFAFTIAIGRNAQTREKSEQRMEIDVTIPPASRTDCPAKPLQEEPPESYGAYPVASLEERRFAAAIDIACLLFAYGGFLALFGSLGGQFTLSKLSAAVYGVTFAIVYLQYFALFTVFGGTTPGMMFRGLQVVSFTGDPPTPRQMLLRTAGYILSAGTFFLGFFWAWWDEDALTWHDRLSHTYLGVLQTHEDLEPSGMAHSHSR